MNNRKYYGLDSASIYNLWKGGFKGRLRRSTYWTCNFLFAFSIVITLYIYYYIAIFENWLLYESGAFSCIGTFNMFLESLFFIIWLLVIAVYILDIILWVKFIILRLHDIGKSGWWSLCYLIPLIGIFLFFKWGIEDSDIEKNKYGPSPKSKEYVIKDNIIINDKVNDTSDATRIHTGGNIVCTILIMIIGLYESIDSLLYVSNFNVLSSHLKKFPHDYDPMFTFNILDNYNFYDSFLPNISFILFRCFMFELLIMGIFRIIHTVKRHRHLIIKQEL